MPGKRLRAGTLTIYVAEDIKEELRQWAESEGRTASNLAAYLITCAVREHMAKHGVPVGAPVRQGGAGDE